jgi:hypothetical protein
VIARRCLPRSRSPMRSACCTPSRRECRGGAPRNDVHAEEAHRITAERVGHRADTQWHSEAVHRMTSCRRRHHGSMPSRCENPSLTGLRRSVRTGASQLRLAMTVTTCVKAIASPLGFGLPPCHICTGTGLTPPTFAPGLGSPLPHLHRDWDPAGSKEPRNCRGSMHLYKAPHKARRIGPAFPAVACQSLPSDSCFRISSRLPLASTLRRTWSMPSHLVRRFRGSSESPVDSLSRLCEVADLGHALVGGRSCRRCSTLRCADCAANICIVCIYVYIVCIYISARRQA